MPMTNDEKKKKPGYPDYSKGIIEGMNIKRDPAIPLTGTKGTWERTPSPETVDMSYPNPVSQPPVRRGPPGLADMRDSVNNVLTPGMNAVFDGIKGIPGQVAKIPGALGKAWDATAVSKPTGAGPANPLDLARKMIGGATPPAVAFPGAVMQARPGMAETPQMQAFKPTLNSVTQPARVDGLQAPGQPNFITPLAQTQPAPTSRPTQPQPTVPAQPTTTPAQAQTDQPLRVKADEGGNFIVDGQTYNLRDFGENGEYTPNNGQAQGASGGSGKAKGGRYDGVEFSDKDTADWVKRAGGIDEVLKPKYPGLERSLRKGDDGKYHIVEIIRGDGEFNLPSVTGNPERDAANMERWKGGMDAWKAVHGDMPLQSAQAGLFGAQAEAVPQATALAGRNAATAEQAARNKSRELDAKARQDQVSAEISRLESLANMSHDPLKVLGGRFDVTGQQDEAIQNFTRQPFLEQKRIELEEMFSKWGKPSARKVRDTIPRNASPEVAQDVLSLIPDMNLRSEVLKMLADEYDRQGEAQ